MSFIDSSRRLPTFSKLNEVHRLSQTLMALADGSGWLSKTQACRLFHLDYDELIHISPLPSDGLGTYYNRSSVEQLALRLGKPPPDLVAVETATRGDFDPASLSPRRKGRGRGTTWTAAKRKYGQLKDSHQQYIKPFAVEPCKHPKSFGKPSKLYYSKDLAELVELIDNGTIPATTPRSSPKKPKPTTTAPDAAPDRGKAIEDASKKRSARQMQQDDDDAYVPQPSPSKRRLHPQPDLLGVAEEVKPLNKSESLDRKLNFAELQQQLQVAISTGSILPAPLPASRSRVAPAVVKREHLF